MDTSRDSETVSLKNLLVLVNTLKKENKELKRRNDLLTEENEFYKAIYDNDNIIIEPEEPKREKSLEEKIRDISEQHRKISDYESMPISNELDNEELNAYERKTYLDRIPSVVMDDTGMQKYLLLKITNPFDRDESKYIVRGMYVDFHGDIAVACLSLIIKNRIPYEILGGGRIEHNCSIIRVYGYSKGYPWDNNKCMHGITTRVLKEKKFGENYTVTFDKNPQRY